LVEGGLRRFMSKDSKLKKLYKNNKKYKDELLDFNSEIDLFFAKKEKGGLGSRHDYLLQNGFWFSPSQISKGIECPRWWYYYLDGELGDPTVDMFSPKSIQTMRIGTAIHDDMQRLFWEMGYLEGLWECVSCRHKFWAIAPKDKCEDCGRFFSWESLKFKEVPIKLPFFQMKGHGDGFLNKNGQRVWAEFKSIKNVTDDKSFYRYGFEYLVEDNKPNDDHLQQTLLYLELWDLFCQYSEVVGSQDPVMQAARVIGPVDMGWIEYIGKNNSERRSFHVKRDKTRVQHLFDEVKGIQQAHKVKDIDSLPALCFSMTEKEKKNKKCRYKSECGICKSN
jgi:hypothetical protein